MARTLPAFTEAARTLHAAEDPRPAEPRFERQALLDREAVGGVDGLAVGQHRLLWEGGDRLRELERAGDVLAAADDLVDESHRERLAGLDDATGEDEVERPAEADHARQPLRAAVDQRDAPAALEAAEAAGVGGDAQVT